MVIAEVARATAGPLLSDAAKMRMRERLTLSASRGEAYHQPIEAWSEANLAA